MDFPIENGDVPVRYVSQKMAIEIVDFPINTSSMVIFQFAMLNYQRVYPINIPLNYYKIPLNHYKIPLNHYKSH